MTVTVDELADFMKAPSLKTAGPDRDLLQETLDAAIEVVEHRVGPVDSATPTFKVHANGKHLVLPATRLTNVTAITDPDGVDVPLEQAELNLLSGIVTLRSASRRGAYTVAVSTRESSASLRQAVKIIASHIWDVQRGSAAGGNRPGFVQPATDGTVVGRGYAIPSRAAELLAPFERVGGTP